MLVASGSSSRRVSLPGFTRQGFENIFEWNFTIFVLKLKCVKRPIPNRSKAASRLGVNPIEVRPGRLTALNKLQTVIESMTKTLESITEAIRDPKHPFRKVDHQPKKAMKHRYERRKIKEFLHLTEWEIRAAEAV